MKRIIPILFILILVSCNQEPQSISEFRGPDKAGIYMESNLLDVWPEEGPEEVFFIEGLGPGYSSPTLYEDHLFITGTRDSLAYLYCYTLDGEKMWEMELGEEWTSHFPGSRSTPTVTGELLYIGTGLGDLYCINWTKAEHVWKLDKKAHFGDSLPVFGHSESPELYDDMLFWMPGQPEDNVIALDRFKGEVLWSSPGKGERSAYNTPLVFKSPSGNKLLAGFSAYHLLGFDVESGDLLWIHEQDNTPLEKRKPGQGDTHANTILYDSGSIYYVEGDGNGAVKLNLSDDGRSISEAWRNKSFDSYMGGIIKIGDHIYGGGTHSKRLLSIDAANGAYVDSLQIGSGVVLAADNKIYYYSQRGSMHLVNYEHGKMTEKSSFRVKKGTKEHFSHPVIYKGVLYLRHGDALMGYKIGML